MARKQDPKDNNQLKGINFNTLLYINIDDRQGCRNCIALIFFESLSDRVRRRGEEDDNYGKF